MDTERPSSFGCSPNDFISEFIDFYNCEISDSDVPPIAKEECFVVWYNYTLGNAKCLVSTVRPDHMYYEMTYNRNTKELYIDAYIKIKHDAVTFS